MRGLGIAVKVGWGLAWSRDREHRLRRRSLGTASLALVVTILAGASLMCMVARQHDRALGRSPQGSPSPRSGDVFSRIAIDHWRGDTITVDWFEPASPAPGATEGSLAPGMTTLPRPGCSAVSPALFDLLREHPSLRRRYPCASELGPAGVVSGHELLAYARPRSRAGMGDYASAIREEDGRIVGRGPLERLSRLGAPPPDLVADTDVLVGFCAFGMAPACLLYAVALRTASSTRRRRFQLLAMIGAPRGLLTGVAVVEALATSLPAVVGGWAVWLLVSARWDGPAWLGAAPGDLALPPAVAVAVLATCVAFVVLMAATGRKGPERSRRRRRRVPTGGWVGAPMAAAAALFLASTLDPVDGSKLRTIGAVLAVAGSPLLVAPAAQLVGRAVGRSRNALAWLAGINIARSPVASNSTFSSLAMLTSLALLFTGYVTAIRSVDAPPPQPSGAVAPAGVEWHSGHLQRFARLLPGDRVFAVELASEEGEPGPRETVVAARCVELRRAGLGLACGSGTAWTLDRADEALVSGEIAYAFSDSPAPVRLVRRLRGGPHAALVLAPGPAHRSDDRIRTAAFQAFSAPTLTTESNYVLHPGPLVAWLSAGMLAATALLLIALLIGNADRVVSSRRPWAHLVTLGMTARRLSAVHVVSLAALWATANVIGVVVGLIIVSAMGDPGAPYPWTEVLVVVLTISTASLAASLAAGRAAIRAFDGNDPSMTTERTVHHGN